MRKPTLTNRDHANMDAFLDHVLEDFKAGDITKEEAVGGLAHVISAIDIGNYGEAVTWLEHGGKLIRSTRSSRKPNGDEVTRIARTRQLGKAVD